MQKGQQEKLVQDESGQTLIQAIFVLPLLFLFLIAIVDFARFYTVQAMLLRSLEGAGAIAATIPYIDQDNRGLDSSEYDYQMFREARRRIIAEAVRHPLETIVSDQDTASSQKLVEWTIVDQGVSGNPAPVIAGAMLIRPGERAQVKTSTGVQWVEHTLFPPNSDGTLPPQRQEMLQKRLPVEVHAWAEVDFILPGWGKQVAVAKAIKYRENVTKGALPASSGDNIPPPTSSSSTTSTTTSTTSVAASTTTTTVMDCSAEWTIAMDLTRQGVPPHDPWTFCVTISGAGTCQVVQCGATGGL